MFMAVGVYWENKKFCTYGITAIVGGGEGKLWSSGSFLSGGVTNLWILHLNEGVRAINERAVKVTNRE